MRKKILQGGAWVLAGQAGTALSQMLIAILLARLLTPNDYGAFQVIQRIVLMGAVIASFGMGWSIVRAVADAMARGNNSLVKLQVKSILTIVVFCSVVVDALYLIYSRFGGYEIFHLDLSHEHYFVLILVFLTAMQQVLPEGFRGMHNLKFASLLSGSAVNILCLAGLLWFVWFSAKADLSIALWILTVSTALVVAISFGSLQHKLAHLEMSGGDVDRSLYDLVKENFRAGVTLTATNMVNFFVNQSDVWIVAAFFSVTDAAYYAAASRLAFLMSSPAMLANGTIRPTIVALWSKGDTVKLESLLRTVATASVVLTVIPLAVLALFGASVMEALFGTFYRDGGEVLFIISLGWFFLLMWGPAGTLLILVGKQRQYFYCTLVSGAVFLLAALILPAYFAVNGVAFAVALGMAVNSALASIYAWKNMGVKTFFYMGKKTQAR